MFTLHPQLASDTVVIGQFDVSLLLLMNDSHYPWCILVPMREGLREIYQLDHASRHAVLEESCVLAEVMQKVYAADKMNVAALGNVVPQLHIHHIARRKDDPAWPQPVWGKHPPRGYTATERVLMINTLCAGLPQRAGFKPALVNLP